MDRAATSRRAILGAIAVVALLAEVKSPANQTKPVATARGPIRLPGRRSQISSPAAIIDQPTATSASSRAGLRCAVRVSW